MNETPAYQAIDIILGLHLNRIAPIKGWYINAADNEGRKAIVNSFCYTEDEIIEKINIVKQFTKYPESVFAYPCWIHDDSNRLFHTPR